MKRILWAFAAVLLIPAAASGAPEPQRSASQTPTEQRQRDGGAQHSNGTTEKSPLRVQIVESPEEASRSQARDAKAQRDEQDERQARHQGQLYGQVQAIFGLLGTFLLCLTLFYTARAANAAKRSADHAQQALDHTVSAAEAASRGADAAESAVQVSREHFVQSNRPYVTVRPRVRAGENVTVHNVDGTAKTGDFALIYAEANNIGTTPAIDLFLGLEIVILPMGLPLKWTELPLDGLPRNVLAPKGEASSALEHISPDEWDAVFKRESALFVRIFVPYRNAISQDNGFTEMFYRAELGAPFSEFLRGNPGSIRFQTMAGCRMT